MVAVIALVLFAAFGVLDGGVRVWLQWRRTGDTGVRRPRSTAQWWARGIFAAGIILPGLVAPVADLLGLSALPVVDEPAVQIVGVAVAALGLLSAFGAQLAMGASWRTTVDPTERPGLVTSGVFQIVRNPVYTAVIVMVIGLALTVPNPIALVGVAAVLLGSELQVRLIEEPYLRRVHGTAYRNYTTQVGRFVPGVGRMRPDSRRR